jgi:serine/threonine protein kinase
MLRRFQLEGISACRVRHPNAVLVLDAGSSNGSPYLVMELLEGPSLSIVLATQGAQRLARCAEIVAPVCDVLEEAHRAGIVHRDIKPANILLSRTPRGEQVKVLDFGIARFVEKPPMGQSKLTMSEGLIGTPVYMAPERLMGQAEDRGADIYSVGVTLFEALTGQLPWGKVETSPILQAARQVSTRPVPIADLRPDLPDELGALVMRTLAREPERRPSLAGLRGALEAWARRWSEPEWPLSPFQVAETVEELLPTVPAGDPAALARMRDGSYGDTGRPLVTFRRPDDGGDGSGGGAAGGEG